ncbi:MAG: fumarylacetoacetate hydrolase family protein [Acidobacteria bacterium]|nr:fumarylacetoacetate hydrolase family protein [Acidobacteriota bacterium]
MHGTRRYAAERDGRLCLIEGDLFGEYSFGLEIARGRMPDALPPGTRMLAPALPSKIIGVGLNYRDHARETGLQVPTEPVIFVKPSTAVIGPGDPVQIPAGAGRVDFEAELGVVIGRRARCVPRSRALGHVLGYTCVNDVTARDQQTRGVQWSQCKGYDTFAPLGPCVAVGLDPSGLAVEAWVNGERRQASTTRELIFPVDVLIEFISSVMTLLPGDVISTGTPAGIGPLAPGDVVRVCVEGVGDLVNPVEAERSRS